MEDNKDCAGISLDWSVDWSTWDSSLSRNPSHPPAPLSRHGSVFSSTSEGSTPGFDHSHILQVIPRFGRLETGLFKDFGIRRNQTLLNGLELPKMEEDDASKERENNVATPVYLEDDCESVDYSDNTCILQEDDVMPMESSNAISHEENEANPVQQIQAVELPVVLLPIADGFVYVKEDDLLCNSEIELETNETLDRIGSNGFAVKKAEDQVDNDEIESNQIIMNAMTLHWHLKKVERRNCSKADPMAGFDSHPHSIKAIRSHINHNRVSLLPLSAEMDMDWILNPCENPVCKKKDATHKELTALGLKGKAGNIKARELSYREYSPLLLELIVAVRKGISNRDIIVYHVNRAAREAASLANEARPY